jgi:hypothetical protein
MLRLQIFESGQTDDIWKSEERLGFVLPLASDPAVNAVGAYRYIIYRLPKITVRLYTNEYTSDITGLRYLKVVLLTALGQTMRH